MICGGKGTEEKNEEKPKAEAEAAAGSAEAKPAEAEAAKAEDAAAGDKKEVTYGEYSEKELKEVFDMMDENGDGKIDAGEVVEFMKKLGVDIDKDTAKEMINRIDDDRNGTP